MSTEREILATEMPMPRPYFAEPLMAEVQGYVHGVEAVFQAQAVDTSQWTKNVVSDDHLLMYYPSGAIWLRIDPHKLQDFYWHGKSAARIRRDILEYVRVTSELPNADARPPLEWPGFDWEQLRNIVAYNEAAVGGWARQWQSTKDARLKTKDNLAVWRYGVTGYSGVYSMLLAGLGFRTGPNPTGKQFKVSVLDNVPEDLLKMVYPEGVVQQQSVYGFRIPRWWYDTTKQVLEAGGPAIVPIWVGISGFVLNKWWSEPCVGDLEHVRIICYDRGLTYWQKPLAGAMAYARVEAPGRACHFPYAIPAPWQELLKDRMGKLASVPDFKWGPDVVCHVLRTVPTLFVRDGAFEGYSIQPTVDKHGQLRDFAIAPVEVDGTAKTVPADRDQWGRLLGQQQPPAPEVEEPYEEAEEEQEEEDDREPCRYCGVPVEPDEAYTCQYCEYTVHSTCAMTCEGCQEAFCQRCLDRGRVDAFRCDNCECWLCGRDDCNIAAQWGNHLFCSRDCLEDFCADEPELRQQAQTLNPEWVDTPPTDGYMDSEAVIRQARGIELPPPW